jgi:NAD(P)-dependent dehydrogenase (short-subunit alcohol dehydrogenase family)
MDMLTNKVAIITGASSGIGRASALLFAREGAKLVIGARGKERLDEVVDAIEAQGGEAIAVVGDVQDESFAMELVATALSRFKQLDIAFNNAGTLGEIIATQDLSRAAWDDVINTNLTSAFLQAKHQLPELLKRRGSLIFTSTFVGHTAGMPQVAAYAASKAGVIGLTQALAVEYGAQGVRVNALLPGGTDTPMGRIMANSPESIRFISGLHALKRIATPEEIAHSALYLASDASSFTTGTAMLVDGGVSINKT